MKILKIIAPDNYREWLSLTLKLVYVREVAILIEKLGGQCMQYIIVCIVLAYKVWPGWQD